MLPMNLQPLYKLSTKVLSCLRNLRRMPICLLLLFSSLLSCHADPSLSSTGMCQCAVSGKVDRLELRDQRLVAVVEIQETPFDFQKEPGHTAVWVLPKLTNLSKKPLSVTVSCALFDEAGILVVALSQGWPKLDPGEKDFQLASCIQRLPVSDFKRIRSCMVSILVGTPRAPSFDMDEDDEDDAAD